MARHHLFEFEDLSWCPAALRDPATAYLRFVIERTGQARPVAAKLREALGRTGSDRILDLCSGGAGPLLAVVDALGEAGLRVRARMTDLYPNQDAFEHVAAASGGAIDYSEKPVDATAVPGSEPGFRTLFNAFHHFRPDAARRILQDAVDAGQPIGVFEFVARSPLAIFGILMSPLPVLFSMPFIRPFRWTQLLFTYVVPLIPLLVVWDGVVSCLRVYSVAELEKLVSELDADHYEWEIGRIALGAVPVKATYLVGSPRSAAGIGEPGATA